MFLVTFINNWSWFGISSSGKATLYLRQVPWLNATKYMYITYNIYIYILFLQKQFYVLNQTVGRKMAYAATNPATITTINNSIK